MKKLTALLLALVMVLAIGSTALATVDPKLGSYEGSYDANKGLDSEGKIPVTKSLIIFNPENIDVREPNIDFVYSVAEVTDATELGTITDDGHNNVISGTDTPVTVNVNAGVPGAVTGTKISFSESNIATAKPTGTEVEKSNTLTVDTSVFNHAGVYRYKITEHVRATGGTSDITDITTYGLEARTGDYDTERYLDLYIVNDNTAANGLKLSSAIIFKTNTYDGTADSHGNEGKDAITTTTDKTTGYEPGADPGSGTGTGSNPDYTNDKEVDRYFTYNLKVGKTTTGLMADKSHDFPFVITLKADTNLAPTVITDLTVNGATNEAAGVRNIKASEDLVLQPKMSNGDYIELKGIPKGTTVTVKETNDLDDAYTASWDAATGTTSTSVTAESDNSDTTDLKLPKSKSAETDAAVAIDGGQTETSGTISANYADTVLGFTNNLPEISPTGVVLRVAPYAIMLGAGIALFIILKVRKNKAVEEA